jgi:hypothetical protein
MEMERAELRVLREFSETGSCSEDSNRRHICATSAACLRLAKARLAYITKAGAKPALCASIAVRWNQRFRDGGSGRAAWTAIHSGRPHRIEELSIRLGVASDDRRPAGSSNVSVARLLDFAVMFMISLVCIVQQRQIYSAHWSKHSESCYQILRFDSDGLFAGSGQPVVRDARIVEDVLPLTGCAVEIPAPDPARYAGQQSIQIKAAVPSELNVSLNNSRGLMAIPRLAKILVLCISECLDGHADPHDVCANGDIDIA